MDAWWGKSLRLSSSVLNDTENEAKQLKRRNESNKLHISPQSRSVVCPALSSKRRAHKRRNRTTAEWKQFEFQMHDINNKIDNEKKEGAEFRSIFLWFQFIQKPLFTRFFIIIAILKASFGNNEQHRTL